MHKPFDAITKTLLEAHPADWLAMIGLGRGRAVRVVNSDLSTVTAEADKVLRVEDGPGAPWLVHVEIQASHDPELPRRLLRYNALLNVRHDLPVHSVAVILWPGAGGPEVNGRFVRESPPGGCRVEFLYPVVNVWELPAAELAAAPGTFPLVAVAARDEEELKAVAAPVLAESRRSNAPDAPELRAMLCFLIGRRFSKQLAEELFRGDQAMRDSVTYQQAVAEGRVEGRVEGQLEEARRIVLRLATRRFGPPDDATRALLEALNDPERLEALADQVLSASGWEELVAATH
ncbi:MAG: DUF4351 domain-containing protein [Isosphaeraceae bacterium]